ncbi:Mitochondrial import inner membrane translocase subunit tim54-like protein [Elsinoe fawcettii]|nr:Mitochondrial import inner membrane translocase subunit tim54-like protein [Elsinoe fawcettii]
MSDPPSASSASPSPAAGTNASVPPSTSGAAAAAEAAPKQNPALKMMGIPNFRLRLPSRNWTIFLTITGSFTAAVLYDKREKRLIQQKWCDLVSPLAQESLAPNQLPRKVRIYVQAPPGDGLTPARELFYEYMKPILVAGGLEWEVVEGRREGDVRWGVAEGVRRERRRRGEGGVGEDEDVIGTVRERAGTKTWDGIEGELVVGRHTWKEFVRGLHEGWLGPVEKPAEPVAEVVAEPLVTREEKAGDGHGYSSVGDAAVETLKDVVEGAEGAADQPAETKPEVKEKTEEEKAEEERKKRFKPGPYNSTLDYQNASIPRSLPQELGPTVVVQFPHLIGFTYTPRRVWRFLHRRELADDIGRQVAALVLGTQYRNFDTQAISATSEAGDSPNSDASFGSQDWRERRAWEQERLLQQEENEWHKSIKKRERVEGQEDVWRDPMVMDERIASRMRVFQLSREDEERAQRIARGELKISRPEDEA